MNKKLNYNNTMNTNDLSNDNNPSDSSPTRNSNSPPTPNNKERGQHDQHDQIQISEEEDVDSRRRRHLKKIRQILTLHITQSTKVTLTAPFDQAVPGCYSLVQPVMPTPRLKSTSKGVSRTVTKLSLGSVGGEFREVLEKEVEGDDSKSNLDKASCSSPVRSAPRSDPRLIDSSTDNFERISRLPTKYLASTSLNSYITESSALVHLSQEDFVSELFKIGLDSKLQTNCTLLDIPVAGVKSGKDSKFDVILLFPNKKLFRYTLLDKETVDSMKRISSDITEGDSVVAYYSVSTPTNATATACPPQDIKTKGFFVVSTRPHKCCQVTLTAEVQVNASARNFNKVMKSAIMIIRTAYDVFYRGDEIDDAVAETFIKSIPLAPELTSQESHHLASTTKMMNEGVFKRVWTGETSVDGYEVFIRKDAKLGKVNKCVATIHLSAERLLALRYAYNSNADMRGNKIKNKDLPRYAYNIPNSHSRPYGGHVHLGLSLSARSIAQVSIWNKVENYEGRGNLAYVLVLVPQSEFILPDETEPPNLPPVSKRVIQGVARGFVSFEALSPNTSKFTFIFWFHFGGSVPTHIADIINSYTVNFVKALQKEYARKKSVVDAERREYYALKLRDLLPDALNEEQLEVVATARVLEQEYLNSPVVGKEVRSSSSFVPMQVKFVPPTNGERSIGTGQASCVFDASAEITTTQIAQNISREGLPTQFQLEGRGLFDRTFVYVRKFPRPFNSREFIYRLITSKHDADASDETSSSTPASYSVSSVSVSGGGAIDYGKKLKVVRGLTLAVYRVTPLGCNDQCQVVFTQQVDAGGFVPTFGVKEVTNALYILPFLRLSLQRDSEIDKEEREVVTNAMERYNKKAHDMYTEDDKALVARVTERFIPLSSKCCVTANVAIKVKSLSSDALVETSSFLAGDGTFSLLSEFVVDSSVEEVTAFLFCQKSRFLSEAYHEEGEKIDIQKISSHRQTVKLMMKRSFKAKEVGKNHSSIEFKSTMAWRRGEGDFDFYDVVSEPFSDPFSKGFSRKPRRMTRMPTLSRVLPLSLPVLQDGANIKNDREGNESIRVAESKRWSYARLERMFEDEESSHRIPQTRVKFYSQLDLDASVQLENADAISRKHHVASAIRLRIYFDRSVELDQVARNAFVYGAMRGASGTVNYSAEEDAIIASCIHRLDDFVLNAKKKEIFVSRLSVNYVGKTKGGGMQGLCIMTIRASPLEVLSHLWNFDARHLARTNSRSTHVEALNTHHKVAHKLFYSANKFVNDREFLIRMLWKELDVESTGGSDKKMFVYVIDTALHKSFPLASGSSRGNAPVRALYTATVKLTQTSDRDTQVEYLLRIGLGDNLDKSIIMKRYASVSLKVNLSGVMSLQQYFQQLVKLRDCDERDGIEIGETLILCRSKKSKCKAENILASHVALVELSKENDFFEPMMTHIAAINLSICVFSSSRGNLNKRTKLVALSKYDGKKLARFLRQMILTSANHGVAIERFQESAAMKEFLTAHPFVKSMISAMCYRIITEHTWDKVFQAMKKTAFSQADVASDFVIIFIYFGEEGGRDTANALMIIIAASLFMQLLLCFCNHYKDWRVMLVELFYTLTFVRGGVLHMRVLTMQNAKGHEAFDTITESSVYRLVEIVFESIPGAFIQASALLAEDGSISPLKYIALAISIGIVSVSVSNTDYRKDSNMKNRTELYQFYGFIPGQGLRKFVVVNLMKVICLTQFCMRIGFCTLMGIKSISFLLLLVLGEFSFYVAIKFVRSDFKYWFPSTGIASQLLTVVIRFAMLELTAATSWLQGRHPYEVGGMLWVVCHIVTHVELLYISFNLDFPGVSWNPADIQQISVILVTVWWVAFSLMLLFGESRYLHTFFSLQTAPQYQKHIFHTGSNITKARFVSKHRSLWEWFELDIYEWLGENWEKWEHESSTSDNAFFTKEWKLKIQKLKLLPANVEHISDENNSAVGSTKSTD